MPFDPSLSLIHLAPEARELFMLAVPRAAARREAPPTPVLQYAGMLGGRFEIGTVFEDRAQMADMYMSYTLPEGERAMIEQKMPTDLTREELEVEHIFIEDRADAVAYGLHPAGSIAGYTSIELDPKPADYWQLVDSMGWFEQSVEGRIAHFAYLHDGSVRVVDFWRTREIGEQWLHANVIPEFDRLYPGKFSEQRLASGWIKLDHFMVGAAHGARSRRFTRREPGSIPG
jgi:hypothetical protein